MSFSNTSTIGVIGLGYVGLPLAVALSLAGSPVVGFDINSGRLEKLRNGHDSTGEIDTRKMANCTVNFTGDAADLKHLDYYIITVPTPITASKKPNMEPLFSACKTIAPQLKKGATVIFESTVYPTATEQECAPILEESSGLKAGLDFRLAYSPERINPGDAESNLQNVIKVVSAQDEVTLGDVANLYETVVDVGVYRANSIAVAEAAKVLENTQRDINIALMNEIALLCDSIGICSRSVIETSATKWNFNKYSPGLVGGHCIGVDPYYLTAKAEEVGYKPELILAGRAINDGIPTFLSQKIIKLLAQADQPVRHAKVGMLGLTFKENVPDFRNSKAEDIVNDLNEFGILPHVHDPFIELLSSERSEGRFYPKPDLLEMKELNCLIIAVPHEKYLSIDEEDYCDLLVPGGVVIDVKSILNAKKMRDDVTYWSL